MKHLHAEWSGISRSLQDDKFFTTDMLRINVEPAVYRQVVRPLLVLLQNPLWIPVNNTLAADCQFRPEKPA